MKRLICSVPHDSFCYLIGSRELYDRGMPSWRVRPGAVGSLQRGVCELKGVAGLIWVWVMLPHP